MAGASPKLLTANARIVSLLNRRSCFRKLYLGPALRKEHGSLPPLLAMLGVAIKAEQPKGSEAEEPLTELAHKWLLLVFEPMR